ncbi:MAG: hypothetical protein HEQ21_18380 [Blastomonas sp.]|uniref:hypothetical protein n=1 Tax=Blastomonas TaxID=150203 RepID=UPI002583883A|nr:hypothetical protein [Blastomonas sp.]MCO5794787.1 hypothetical protein [Blastomonas sp.]
MKPFGSLARRRSAAKPRILSSSFQRAGNCSNLEEDGGQTSKPDLLQPFGSHQVGGVGRRNAVGDFVQPGLVDRIDAVCDQASGLKEACLASARQYDGSSSASIPSRSDSLQSMAWASRARVLQLQAPVIWHFRSLRWTFRRQVMPQVHQKPHQMDNVQGNITFEPLGRHITKKR